MQDGTFSPPGHRDETPAARGDLFARDCPTRRLLDRIGDKWSALSLLLLDEEPRRFNDRKRRIDGISQKMLSQTLRALERDGLLTRHVAATVPVQVSYRLTPLGQELIAALRPMMAWAEARMPEVLAAQRAYERRENAEGA